MNKRIRLLYLLLFSTRLFAVSLDDVEIDIQCFLNYGYRPISLGIEKYIDSQGRIQNFGISTFAAINGKGFFCLKKHNNSFVLTRNGFFFFNEKGLLVNHDGYLVLHKDSNLEKDEYKYISRTDLFKKNRILKKTDSLAEKYKNAINSSPYLLVIPIEDLTVINGEYLSCTKFERISTEIIQGAREFNSMQFSQLYDLCCKCFDEYRGKEFTIQKERIIAKLEVVISYMFNSEPYSTEIITHELMERINFLRKKV